MGRAGPPHFVRKKHLNFSFKKGSFSSSTIHSNPESTNPRTSISSFFFFFFHFPIIMDRFFPCFDFAKPRFLFHTRIIYNSTPPQLISFHTSTSTTPLLYSLRFLSVHFPLLFSTSSDPRLSLPLFFVFTLKLKMAITFST